MSLQRRITTTGIRGPIDQLDGIVAQMLKAGMQRNLQHFKEIIESTG